MNSFYLVQKGRPALALAPMEGVTDFPMRTLLTERGGFSFCVAEFLRISQEIPPAHVFYDHVPELKNKARTFAGTPVQIQLLGGDEERMARSALRACEEGAEAIDLNFGCPAKTVNKNDGGAAILRCPSRIQGIVSAVRKAVPAHIPVSAKLRLGWESVEEIYATAEQAVLGGASWLTIHARTRMQGYAPPVYWKYIGEIRRRYDIPVVANGDIWTLEDFQRCRDETECEHFMIGRGALADPTLPHAIARELGIPVISQTRVLSFDQTPEDWRRLLGRFAEICEGTGTPDRILGRMKQWVRMAHNRSPLPWFDQFKRCQPNTEIPRVLGLLDSYCR